MIVCICHGASAAEIASLVAGGNDSLATIARACGAGTDCGACRGQIEEIIEAIGEEGEERSACRFLRVLPGSPRAIDGAASTHAASSNR
jgi:bacterioferritin-associated ferredoxin